MPRVIGISMCDNELEIVGEIKFKPRIKLNHNLSYQ